MTQLDEVDAELAEIMASMARNEQYDTGNNDSWKNGWVACDQRRIIQIHSLREKVWRMRQAGG